MHAGHYARRSVYRTPLGLFAAAVCFWPAFAVAGSLSIDDTATGTGALNSENGGYQNTADGYFALGGNVSGADNTATGAYALQYSTANFNTADGMGALASTTSGASNTGVGFYALEANSTGKNNVALGYYGLRANTTGSNNIAVGYNALAGVTTGIANMGLGTNAGIHVAAGSANIEIANPGATSDDHVIRIGTVQTKTFIAGIKGAPLSGATVVVSASGQLGVIKSSARYKKNIRTLDDTSDKLAQLRPVSYEYKTEPGVTHFGLVAEEVDKVLPELVIRDEKNRPDSVQYQELIPLLLQQWKAQYAENTRQSGLLAQQRAELAQLQGLVAQQRTELAALRQSLATRLVSVGGSDGRERIGAR